MNRRIARKILKACESGRLSAYTPRQVHEAMRREVINPLCRDVSRWRREVEARYAAVQSRMPDNATLLRLARESGTGAVTDGPAGHVDATAGTVKTNESAR